MIRYALLEKLRQYTDRFQALDDESSTRLIPNDKAPEWLGENIPLLDCPDSLLEEIYYFRWWVFRKHWKETEAGHVLTEFLPDVPLSLIHI